MTLPPSDAPDWTGIPGGVRYLGMLDMSGTNVQILGNFTFSPASYDGAIYVIPTGSPNSSAEWAVVTMSCNTLSVLLHQANYYEAGRYLADPFVGFVSAAMGAAWEVDAVINNATASDWKLYIFAAPSFPLSRIVRDQLRLLVSMNGTPAHNPYPTFGNSAPAAGVRASVVFPAVLGQRWVLDHAAWRLMGRGAADIQLARVLDGAAVMYSERLSVQALVGDRDEHIAGPLVGYNNTPGNTMTVEFAAAPGAANFEVINAGAYLWPVAG